MATTKAKVFELPVYERGKLTKTLTNDTGVITFGAIDDFSKFYEMQDEIAALQEGVAEDPLAALSTLSEALEPVLFEFFADYEEGDIRGVPFDALVEFMGEYGEYMGARMAPMANRGAAAKNRQGVAPQKKR